MFDLKHLIHEMFQVESMTWCKKLQQTELRTKQVQIALHSPSKHVLPAETLFHHSLEKPGWGCSVTVLVQHAYVSLKRPTRLFAAIEQPTTVTSPTPMSHSHTTPILKIHNRTSWISQLLAEFYGRRHPRGRFVCGRYAGGMSKFVDYCGLQARQGPQRCRHSSVGP